MVGSRAHTMYPLCRPTGLGLSLADPSPALVPAGAELPKEVSTTKVASIASAAGKRRAAIELPPFAMGRCAHGGHIMRTGLRSRCHWRRVMLCVKRRMAGGGGLSLGRKSAHLRPLQHYLRRGSPFDILPAAPRKPIRDRAPPSRSRLNTWAPGAGWLALARAPWARTGGKGRPGRSGSRRDARPPRGLLPLWPARSDGRARLPPSRARAH